MLAEQPLDTIDQGLGNNYKNCYVSLADTIPLKSRTGTATSISTCSVATEKGFPESRDANHAVDIREVDCTRDGAADNTIRNAETREGFVRRCMVEPPLFATPKAAAAAVDVDALAPATEEETLQTKEVAPSNDSSSGSNIGYSCSPLPLLTRTGNNIDAAILHFYSTLEVGVGKMFPCSPCSSPVEKKVIGLSCDGTVVTAVEALGASVDAGDQNENTSEPIRNTKSQDTVESEEPSIMTAKGTIETVKTQSTISTINTQYRFGDLSSQEAEVEEILEEAEVEVQLKAQSGCCLTSGWFYSGSDHQEVKELGIPQTNNEMIGESLIITTSEMHTLDTFSDDNTFDSTITFVSPKAQSLLDEIEQIESSLFEVRESASTEQASEIKKLQEPFIHQMSTIKNRLLDQQVLLQSAPEDTKSEYYRAISHAAILNAEVETQRAELELKKIRLESMKVEDQICELIGDDDTFSMDSLTTKESDEERAFDIFARYTAKNFEKMRKKRSHKGQVVAR